MRALRAGSLCDDTTTSKTTNRQMNIFFQTQ